MKRKHLHFYYSYGMQWNAQLQHLQVPNFSHSPQTRSSPKNDGFGGVCAVINYTNQNSAPESTLLLLGVIFSRVYAHAACSTLSPCPTLNKCLGCEAYRALRTSGVKP